jgi:hypothetical protein
MHGKYITLYENKIGMRDCKFMKNKHTAWKKYSSNK